MPNQTTAVAARNKWEDVFEAWSRPPGKTEQERCDNTVTQICDAIKAHPNLANKGVDTFPQGSYANRVNVRKDSDVDVCCRHRNDLFFSRIPDGYKKSDFGIIENTDYSYADYKNDVEAALVARFGRKQVTRGNKAFDVHENTRRVDADAVATFAYRQYFLTASGHDFHEGTALITDRERTLVTNFPKQQYDNGIRKNDDTGRRFKKQVRIQKSLRNHMSEHNNAMAEPITSFLIESWVWCAPNTCFGHATLFEDFEAVVEWVYGNTAGMKEVNGVKDLFSVDTPWTETDVRAFLQAAWEITH